MKAMTAMGCVALLLAGCGKSGEKAASGPMSAEQVAATMDSVKLEPGEWEATQEILDVKMTNVPEGMPASAMQQMIGRKNTMRHCVTPEQAAKPGADFLNAQKDANCTYENMNMSGGTIKGAMTCTQPANGPGNASGNGKPVMKMTMAGTYLPASYAMTMETNMSGMPNGMGIAMKIKTNGKRIGDCPAGSASGPKAPG